MADPPLVLNSYLLANYCNAYVFDEESRNFQACDDLDGLHLFGARNATHALGDCSFDAFWSGSSGKRCPAAGGQWSDAGPDRRNAGNAGEHAGARGESSCDRRDAGGDDGGGQFIPDGLELGYFGG